MPLCPQCSDFLREGADECHGCGWTPPKKPTTPTTQAVAWTPPTEPYTGEPWEGREPLPPEVVEPYLAQLREIVAKGQADRVGAILTPEKLARFHAACKAKGYDPSVLERIPEYKPPDRVPRPPKPMTPERMAFKRRLAEMFPVTEAEEARNRRST